MGCSISSILRTAVVAVAMSILAAGRADASFISTSPDPILGGDLVSSGAPIASPFGYVTFTIANVIETSNIIVGGNDFISYSASPILTFYTDSTLNTVASTATLQGQFQIEIFGRTSPFETGSFNFQFVSSTATGTVGGSSVSVQLDPTQVSGGTTMITSGPGVGQYTINTIATQYSEFSVDGVPSGTVGPIPLTGVAAVPEPASLTMLGTALAGLIVVRRRRRAA